MTEKAKGSWWFSLDSSCERFDQADSREHAITELDGRPGQIGFGSTPEVKLSDQIDAFEMIEGFEDNLYDVSDPDGDGLFADVTTDQVKDLTQRLRKASDEWQAQHDLAFTQWGIVWSDGPYDIPARD